MSLVDKDGLLERAKKYSEIKYVLSILGTFYFLLLLFIFAGSGSSKFLKDSLVTLSPHFYFVLPVYLLVIFIAYGVMDFPLNLYHSFILERRFSLSTQKFTPWLGDQLKEGAVAYIIGAISLGAFYYLLKSYPFEWWLLVSLAWIFFSLILVKLAPLVIIPLFFKYKKLADESLRSRIISLASKMKVKILDVFEIDFSKKTTKANAAFVGIGSTKRILLADTLKDKYSPSEIEAILAHEFAHYRLRHLVKLVLINSSFTVLYFYLIYKTSFYAMHLFNFSSLEDVAAMPIVFIYFTVFGLIMQPLGNYISRRFETDADLLAIKTCGSAEAFISMMEKLAAQNLADRNPHPAIKFFFFDHPPIDERIAMARAL